MGKAVRSGKPSWSPSASCWLCGQSRGATLNHVIGECSETMPGRVALQAVLQVEGGQPWPADAAGVVLATFGPPVTASWLNEVGRVTGGIARRLRAAARRAEGEEQGGSGRIGGARPGRAT